jgi:hypothetical protein
MLPSLRLRRPKGSTLALSAYVALALCSGAALATAGGTLQNDMSGFLPIGQGGTGGFGFASFWLFLTGPFGMTMSALLCIGSVWRLRQNFEWGEAGTTIAMLVLGVGVIASLPAIWDKLHNSSGALLS